MNDKLITALLAILLALGGWNLSQTFKLSNEMTEIKVKVEQVEKVIGKSLKKNKVDIKYFIHLISLFLFSLALLLALKIFKVRYLIFYHLHFGFN